MKLLLYLLFEKYIYFLALEMASTVPVVSAHFQSLCSAAMYIPLCVLLLDNGYCSYCTSAFNQYCYAMYIYILRFSYVNCIILRYCICKINIIY